MQNSASAPLVEAPQVEPARTARSAAYEDDPDDGWYVDLRSGRIVRRRSTAIDTTS